MSAYTVVSASKKKDVEGKHGPMQVVAMRLRNEAGIEKDVEWFTKATTALPAPQSTVDGDVTQGEYGLKFKKAQQAGSGFSGNGNRPRDPAERESIERQVAAKCATELIVAWLPQSEARASGVDLDTLLGWHNKLATGIAQGIKG